MNMQHLTDLNILAKTPEPHKPATPGIWRASIVHILKHMHNFDSGNICTLPKRFRVGEKKWNLKLLHINLLSSHLTEDDLKDYTCIRIL